MTVHCVKSCVSPRPFRLPYRYVRFCLQPLHCFSSRIHPSSRGPCSVSVLRDDDADFVVTMSTSRYAGFS